MHQERSKPKDPMLDVPAEANREKHINFLADEDNEAPADDKAERDRVTERRREWEEGLRAGREQSNDE